MLRYHNKELFCSFIGFGMDFLVGNIMIQVMQSELFYPQVEGHLTFKRVT